MAKGETYEVSIKEQEPDGRLFRRILLRTKDREEANALVWSLEQDGQKCLLKVIPAGQVE